MAAFFRIVRTLIASFLLLLVAVLVATQGDDWAIMVLLGGPAGIIGGALLRGVLRERKRLAQEDSDAREVAVLRLALAEGGTLTATQVATRLSWPMEMALATLRLVEDGSHITSRVTDDGVLVFEFRELIHAPVRRSLSPAPAEAAALSVAVAPEEASR